MMMIITFPFIRSIFKKRRPSFGHHHWLRGCAGITLGSQLNDLRALREYRGCGNLMISI
jgi:hypothetical protein